MKISYEIDTKLSVPVSGGEAIDRINRGFCMMREGWNGKGMFVFKYVPDPREEEPYTVMYTAQGRFQAGWVISEADRYANDWHVVFPTRFTYRNFDRGYEPTARPSA